ncbi:hypothetical protein QYE76_067245 [Lolium multiflorum]|uniref:Transposase (putative) gypsy type domain-containing protein n=1 Tax=Lolium multiflorum TaxID=4521 RepID=A0AAD8SEG4_LOLMU|nr:hypothetical protein QYE76_067245 [Lolium multiflorum]
MATAGLGSAKWERSKISAQDINLLKKMGFSKKESSLRFPKEESYPKPPIEYRLTPNSILHVSIFITPCECFLGVQPNWALWKRIFCVRRNGSHGVTYNIGGVVICVRSDVEYFDVKFPDSVQGYFPESEVAGSQKSAASSKKEAESEATASTHSLPPAVSPRNKRKRDEVADSGSSKAEEVGPSEGKTAFDPYLDALVSSGDEEENPPIDVAARTTLDEGIHPSFGTQFVGYRDYAKKAEENLVEANKRADALARKLEQSEKARKKAEADAKKAKADAAAVEDLRQRLHDAETSLSDNMDEQAAREKEILSRVQSQSRRFVRKTHQDFDLECPEGDQLLDELSLLEFHGEEAREGLAEARAGLSRLFPYFFPKTQEPKIFTNLAKHFNSQEDLGLKLHQEGLKVGVEGTVALVADSQQDVDWTKVGDTMIMETKRWQSLIKAARPNAKKILAYLGCKPTPAPSSSKPEVK